MIILQAKHSSIVSNTVEKTARERVMSKWIVVTEVESEVDPAVFSYVNGTILISSKLKGESND